jgi:hypothetical protein
MHVPNDSKSNKSKKVIPVIILLLVLGAAVNAVVNIANNQGYAPDQPIPFSHKKHAGQYNIPCMYCHVGVEKSKHAVVPSMNICMNCHAIVKTDSPHIQKLTQYFKEGKEIPWVKVHDLPDFVEFNHKRHVTKGIACETCHGEVKKMAIVHQDQPMTMGWCLDCHRGVTTPAFLKEAAAKNPPAPGVPAGGVAPTSCYTCHH